MKFRPYINLRFRSEAQYDDVKDRADKADASVNEWILGLVERANPGLVGEEPKKVKPKAKVK